MRYWFQNLNESKSNLFNFRGSVSIDRKQLLSYELVSGPALRATLTHGCGDETQTRITLGLLLFTIYLTLSLPRWTYFRRKVESVMNPGSHFWLTEAREYGFYFYHFAFVWAWHQRPHESSSKDPWWMRQYIHLDELLFGKMEQLEDQVLKVEDVWFRIGEKEFVLNSIEWKQKRRFRRFIPFSLWHRSWISVEMKIEDPPMISGKGENSWDCDDDGTFGVFRVWPYLAPSYLSSVVKAYSLKRLNYDTSLRLAVQLYVEGVMSDAKRYGGSSGERGIRHDQKYEFIGRRVNA